MERVLKGKKQNRGATTATPWRSAAGWCGSSFAQARIAAPRDGSNQHRNSRARPRQILPESQVKPSRASALPARYVAWAPRERLQNQGVDISSRMRANAMAVSRRLRSRSSEGRARVAVTEGRRRVVSHAVPDRTGGVGGQFCEDLADFGGFSPWRDGRVVDGGGLENGRIGCNARSYWPACSMRWSSARPVCAQGTDFTPSGARGRAPGQPA